MPVIMCTQNLWKIIGGAGPLPPRSPKEVQDTRLGVWSANVASYPQGTFVVALNELTYTTIVFPLIALPGFVTAFALAVGIQLSEAGIPGDAIRSEVEPFFTTMRYRKNSNRSLLGSLNDVCFHVGWHLEDAGGSDAETLLRIQCDLNDMPHVNVHPGGANRSLRLLFADAAHA